jgi:hypothetical protein
MENISIDTTPYTGVRDVDRLILLNLDYKSLLAACSTDSHTNKICRDDFFWRQKVEKDMGSEVVKNKLPDMSCRDQYLSLINNMTGSKAFRHGRLDYIVWKTLYPFRPTVPAYHGWINILEWMEKNGVKMDDLIMDAAIEGGRINVIEWLCERGIYPHSCAYNEAFRLGQLGVLRWLLGRGFVPKDKEQEVLNHINELELLLF